MSFHWGYTNENGPHTWAKHFPCASGARQSPILIDSAVAKLDEKLLENPLTINLGVDSGLVLHNTGSGCRIDIGDGNHTLSGGPLESGDVYQMVQFHFHWGSQDKWGSEHLMDGQAFASEMHMVFYNSTKFDSVNEAVVAPNGLAVLGSFIETGNENAAMIPIFEKLDSIRVCGSQTALETPMNLADLLPGQLDKYYTYLGSLTTPPCSESVTWFVFKDAISMSPSQLSAFRSIRTGDENSDKIQDNFRPPVPLGSRPLNCSF